MIIFTKEGKKNERGETKRTVSLFDTSTGIEFQLVTVKKAKVEVKVTISSVHSDNALVFYGEPAKQAIDQIRYWDKLSPVAMKRVGEEVFWE